MGKGKSLESESVNGINDSLYPSKDFEINKWYNFINLFLTQMAFTRMIYHFNVLQKKTERMLFHVFQEVEYYTDH